MQIVTFVYGEPELKYEKCNFNQFLHAICYKFTLPAFPKYVFSVFKNECQIIICMCKIKINIYVYYS